MADRERAHHTGYPRQGGIRGAGRLALAGLLRDRGYTADAVADLKLALTEACSNCIRHAYDSDSGQVHLSL